MNTITQPDQPTTRLEALFEIAIDLDEIARADFLHTVEPQMRDALARMLRAVEISSPLDRVPAGLTDAAAILAERTEPPNTIEAGQRIGHYRLIRLLGEGGMASVWLAERNDGAFSHQVAVKCLKTGLGTPESRNRFLREQQILAQLQHPNIARWYDAGISGEGVPFIVMEWIDGLSLTRHCDEKRLSIRKRLVLFQKICAAVAYAHQNLIVHRDIKPGNVLVGADGEPKLLDFGIAKLLDENEPVTRSGLHLLTPEYAAPEQFSGSAITTATDVYSLGGVLYELLCGIKPRHFMRRDALTAITAPSDALRRIEKNSELNPKQLAEHRFSAPERLRRTLRGDLDTIVMKALQTEPQRRYPTAQSLSEDLDRYTNQQPIRARKDAWAYRLEKFLTRHALGVGLTVFTLAVLFTATTISLYQAQLTERQIELTQTEAKRALAVKGFLTNLFEISDSGLPRDQVPTTQALLEDGVKRIQGEFNDTPELKLDLLLLLGRVQRNLGLYDRSEVVLKEAVKIADERVFAASEVWLQAHLEWVKLLFSRSEVDQALQQLTAAVEKHINAGGRDNAALAGSYLVLSNIYRQLDRFNPAIDANRKASEIFINIFGEKHPKVQETLQDLGITLSAMERLEEAEAIQRACVDLSKQIYGEHHALYAVSLAELAFALTKRRKDAEAEPLARQALSILERVHQQPNIRFINALSPLGEALLHQQKLDEAESVFNRLKDIQTQLTSADHPNVVIALYSLGEIADFKQEYTKAEALFRQALAITRKNFGPHHSSAVFILTGLGAGALAGQHRYAEAAAAILEALEITKVAHGYDAAQTAEILYDLAGLEMNQDHLSQALGHLEEASKILLKQDAPRNPIFIYVQGEKSAILNRLRRYREARDVLEPLLPQMRLIGLPPLIGGLIELGRAQMSLGETDSAVRYWEEGLALLKTMPSTEADDFAELKQLLASAHKSIPITPANPTVKPKGT